MLRGMSKNLISQNYQIISCLPVKLLFQSLYLEPAFLSLTYLALANLESRFIVKSQLVFTLLMLDYRWLHNPPIDLRTVTPNWYFHGTGLNVTIETLLLQGSTWAITCIINKFYLSESTYSRWIVFA